MTAAFRFEGCVCLSEPALLRRGLVAEAPKDRAATIAATEATWDPRAAWATDARKKLAASVEIDVELMSRVLGIFTCDELRAHLRTVTRQLPRHLS